MPTYIYAQKKKKEVHFYIEINLHFQIWVVKIHQAFKAKIQKLSIQFKYVKQIYKKNKQHSIAFFRQVLQSIQHLAFSTGYIKQEQTQQNTFHILRDFYLEKNKWLAAEDRLEIGKS
eukprot:TRINITY_DN10999_c0_g1_i1.p3 TRINITY_DN10999_c0_g1~~TRINITY_DN10999_c0_g1_i1.p3  ORF type:complete len:117 (-),score=4.31 TRINITY_DN10999_c0_g1_i1:21-371(-)